MKAKEGKKLSKRSRTKYPALKKEVNVRTRRDYIEADYINGVYAEDGRCVIRPLSDEEKEWLNKFYEEYVVTSFKKDGTDFFETDEERRKAYRDNNYRNSCIMNIKSATGQLESFDDVVFDRVSYNRFAYLDSEIALINSILPEEDED